MTRSRPRVLHAIHDLSTGGASQAMLALAMEQGRNARIQSLTSTQAELKAQAIAAGVEVAERSDHDHALAALGGADIVHVHLWNTPELQRFMRAELPPVRLVAWIHIAGRGIPQVIATPLLQRCDLVVASSTRCLEHVAPGGSGCPLPPRTILPARGLARFSGIERRATGRFNVGYVGSLDENKLHPNVVNLFARTPVPNAQFFFVGDGQARARLEHAAAATGKAESFRFTGHTKDIAPHLAELDLFAFPMSRNSYASADLAIMEAMGAGIPVVVFPPEGRSDMVRHGIDGIVARSADEFSAAIAHLAGDHALLRRMGVAAREGALVRFSPTRSARDFEAVYEELMSLPKRPRLALAPVLDRAGRRIPAGVEALLFAFDSAWPALDASFHGEGGRAIAADMEIAGAGTGWLGAWIGGLVHYSRNYPRDPWLTFWRGLNLAGQGRPVRALANFSLARELGFPQPDRLEFYREIILADRTRLRDRPDGTFDVAGFVNSVFGRTGAAPMPA